MALLETILFGLVPIMVYGIVVVVVKTLGFTLDITGGVPKLTKDHPPPSRSDTVRLSAVALCFAIIGSIAGVFASLIDSNLHQPKAIPATITWQMVKNQSDVDTEAYWLFAPKINWEQTLKNLNNSTMFTDYIKNQSGDKFFYVFRTRAQAIGNQMPRFLLMKGLNAVAIAAWSPFGLNQGIRI